ncbi:MAG TPA: beta-glucosidase BglX [Candidatus Lokiarchaeia archaeon]|nr:beta-glucosidase BglX [Candidatus Lokiarchaeia archaeon]
MAENFEGLWKFTMPLPGHGLLNCALDLAAEGDNVQGSICIGDVFENDLEDIAVDGGELVASSTVFGQRATITVSVEEEGITGELRLGSQSIAIHGWHFDVTRRQEPAVPKEKYDLLVEVLKNKKARPIKLLSESEIEQKVQTLLAKMTIEEKVGQMVNMTPSGGFLTGPEMGLKDAHFLISKGLAGSILNTFSAVSAYLLQKTAMEKSRLKIPLFFGSDVIHGMKTIFPVPLAMASSWDMHAIEKAARTAAIEATVAGINVTWAPMVDIARDPRWGRIMEGAGEDPYLGSCVARAIVKGFQGKGIGQQDSLVACVKHFAAYGGAEAGRDYNTVDMSEYRLRNEYLPPYKAAVDAGCGMVMNAFNALAGMPAVGNRHLLNDILREEWGFKGVIGSDYNSVMELIAHGVAKDEAAAAKLALDATLDIEMPSQCYTAGLPALIETGQVSESQVDEAVARILRLKFMLGLFDDPYRFMDIEKTVTLHLCQDHRDTARDVGKRSMVLLKNDKIEPDGTPVLPLKAERLQDISRIALIGPFAREKAVIGGWAAIGNPADTIDLETGIKAKLDTLKETTGQDIELVTAKGCAIVGDSTSGFTEAIEAAASADIIILALGESQDMSGECRSRARLNVPGAQEDLAKEIKAAGKPMVLVLFNGRPLVIPWLAKNMDAILDAWFPGTESGNAIADVLFGDYNPSGKLPASFPVTEGQIPVYYAHLGTGRPILDPARPDMNPWVSKYIDIPNEPLYTFGHGLSYTSFSYSEIVLDKSESRADAPVQATITVTNTGNVAGEEIVQLYIRDVVATMERPVKELKGFTKISLDPGTSVDVVFLISDDMLGFYNKDNVLVVEPGDFTIFIGPSSVEGKQATFSFS